MFRFCPHLLKYTEVRNLISKFGWVSYSAKASGIHQNNKVLNGQYWGE